MLGLGLVGCFVSGFLLQKRPVIFSKRAFLLVCNACTRLTT